MAMSLPVTIIAAPPDLDFARRLQSDLGLRGVSAAVESSDSHPSPVHFTEALAHLLERANVCLILLSPSAQGEDLVARVQSAIASLQAGAADVKLLFLSLAPAGSLALPPQLASIPLLDLTRLPYDAALSSIQALIGTRTITGAPAPQAPTPSAPDEADELAVESAADYGTVPDLGHIALRGWGPVPPEESGERADTEPEASPDDTLPRAKVHTVPRQPQEQPQAAPAAASPPPPPAPAPAPAGAPPLAPAAPPSTLYPPVPNGAPPQFDPSLPPPYAAPPQPLPGSAARGPGRGGGWSFGGGGGDRSAPRPTREKGAPASRQRETASPPARELPLEQATFTAYHPKEMPPRVWQPLLVYISLDTPAALARVSAAATDRLAGRRDQFRAASAAESTGLRRGSKLTIVPDIPGFRANPPEMTVAWEEDAQQHEFRLRAETARPGQAANGTVKIYMGPILRGEIPISIYVQPSGVTADLPDNFASVVARAYRKVFASYSHRDTVIVRTCETAAQTMGDRYLRDVTLLRSGEHWDERLLDAVTEADIFQLFWSEHAATSPAVEKEWRRALSLVPVRGQFIRPVYWSREPYRLPPELAAIHFERLDLARLGWSPARAFLYTVLGIG